MRRGGGVERRRLPGGGRASGRLRSASAAAFRGARVGSATFRFGGSLEGGARRVGYVPLRRQPSGGRASGRLRSASAAAFRGARGYRFVPLRRQPSGEARGYRFVTLRLCALRSGLRVVRSVRRACVLRRRIGPLRLRRASRAAALRALRPLSLPLAAMPSPCVLACAPLRYSRTASPTGSRLRSTPLQPHCPPPGSRLRSTPPPLRTAPLQAAAYAPLRRPSALPPKAAAAAAPNGGRAAPAAPAAPAIQPPPMQPPPMRQRPNRPDPPSV